MALSIRLKALFICLIIASNPTNLFSQHHKFGFQNLLETSPKSISTFCVPNNEETISLLNKDNITIKYSSSSWLFISTTAKWIDDKTKSKELKNYYFEYAPPVALGDSALVAYHVKPVHDGTGGLNSIYTGDNVIIGYVDQGIDWNHPDFIDANGNTRVMRYWDHSTNVGGTIPQPYNYGIVWDSAQINNGTCTSTEEGSAHGTTVAGMGSANGFANGSNKGMAPNSRIIMVETNFNLPNWSLTIADACDYIFKVADSMGMPAIVNLSLGSYLGSHDGNDPATDYIESLLDEHPGRIVVGAAGNAGAKGKYHVTGNVDADTSFVWLQNNPSSSAAFGANHIYFDLWSDLSDGVFDYAFGADLPSPLYGLRGSTIYRPAQASVGTPIFDTIFNSLGNRIATIEIYTELIDGNYHMEAYFSNVDSTAYNFRFSTTGSGKYDLWSGAWLGLNNLITTLPSPSVLPEIIHYHMPDSLQTIVSNWACSEKVITVGNVRNRLGHIDNNGNQYYPSTDMTPPGKLSPNSSVGPSRHGLTKPDISAAGDVSLTAAPFWLLTNPTYNTLIDSGGWHARNGGTSMASPCVAGIAALYLEKCNKANYASFKSDLIATAFTDSYTGVVPNNSYGFGKPHALNLLQATEFTATVLGSNVTCGNPPSILSLSSSSPLASAIWSNGGIGLTDTISTAGDYSALVYSARGCAFQSDTLTVTQLPVLPILPIMQSGNTLASLSFTDYQWTLNGIDIPGATNQTLDITAPFGTYTCYCTSVDGCISETPPMTITLGLNGIDSQEIMLFPNPTNDYFTLLSEQKIVSVRIFSENGKELTINNLGDKKYSIAGYPSGIYHVIIEFESEKIYSKITRM